MDHQVTEKELQYQINRRALIAGIGGLAAGATLFAGRANAGPLAPPPGPIGSTGRTVQEIYDKIARTDAGLAEPRIPVQSLPGSATALHVISQPGSYYLTGNIVGEAGKNGIEISTSNVKLDLCGFELRGAANALSALRATGATFPKGVEIRDGSILSWPQYGVDLLGVDSALVDGLHVRETGDRAIRMERGMIRDCRIQNCGGFDGSIASYTHTIIEDCLVLFSGVTGIFLVGGSIIRNCLVAGSQQGFVIQENGEISGSHAMSCGVGFSGSRCEIIDCVSSACSVGFRAHLTRLRECAAQQCSVGIELSGSHCVAERNQASLCDIGISTTGGATACMIVSNHVENSKNPFSISSGNAHGPIVNVSGVGDITSVPGANHPWANFIY